MSQDSKRRLCKFTPSWCLLKEFSSWLVPVKYQSQKAYCILCKRVFSVSHSGLHDVKAHWKGKKHLQLQEKEMEKRDDERLERRIAKASTLVFNEELNTLEEYHSSSNSESRGSHSSRSQDRMINNSFGRDEDKDDEKHFMNEDIIVGNILTPTITIESDPESSPPVSVNVPDKENMSLQIKSQVSSQQYCLRWKYHHSNLQFMFIQLLQRESFCDVTLACEGKMLRAHKILGILTQKPLAIDLGVVPEIKRLINDVDIRKVVLSACSTYFDKIFSEHEEKDPVVILKDVKFVDIKALVEFMYKGEINVENSHLTSLLKTAEELKIKGLADVSGKAIPKEEEDDDDDSVMYGPSHGESKDDDNQSETKNEQNGDYDEMFAPTVGDGDRSLQDGSDNDDDKKDDEMGDDNNDYGDSGNEQQNFSTLISCLSDHPSQDYHSEDQNDIVSSEHDNSETTSNLAGQFPDVIKMNDYLATGRRQQFWEEPFTRRLMEAIKNKEIEMKTAAELMGVSYGTLYGRYRDAYGCLKHPYRTKEFWSEQGPADILTKLQKKEITLFRAAEMLNVTVTTLANYLTTIRKDKERDSDTQMEEDEEMDVSESMEVFLSDQVSSKEKNSQSCGSLSNMNMDGEDEDSRSSSTAVDRSDEDYP